MNNQSSEELPQREVFIVRLLLPRGRPAAWQAQIQHISSGKISYVRNSQELVDCIFKQIELPPLYKTGQTGLK